MDGLNTLTVFETRAGHAGCCSPTGGTSDAEEGSTSCLLADYGYTRFAAVGTTDPTFVAVGDLAPEALARVVEGLRRRAAGATGSVPSPGTSDR